MNEEKIPPAEDEDDDAREELVAYLDGELDPQDSSRVEKMLTDKPEYRDEMVRMEKVWGVLDSVPRIPVDEAFTNTTVEMVAVAAEKEVDHQREVMPVQKLARYFAIGCIVFLTGMVGYLSAQLLFPAESVWLQKNLPVIKNVDPYLVHGDDPPGKVHDFAELLNEDKLFAREEAGNGGE